MSTLKTEHTFRLWEPQVAAVVANWPAATTIDPQGRSPHYLQTRFNIAVNWLRENRETPVSFDKKKFFSLVPVLRTSTTKAPGFLWVGPKDATRPVTAVAITLTGDLDEDSLRKLLAFVATGHCGPISLNTHLPLHQIAAEFDVEVEQQGSDKYLIA